MTLPHSTSAITASRMTRFAAAALMAGMATTIGSSGASAQSFLEGKSAGMQRCVRAMLGGYTVKKVKVHGHHFHCKPLVKLKNTRRIVLDHEQVGFDDKLILGFLVDRQNELIPDTLDVFHLKGISPKFPLFKAVKLGKFDYGQVVREARAIKPKKQAHWQKVVEQITYLTIAELGNSGAKKVRCNVPVFWEHDNFRGTAVTARSDLTYLQKVQVNGRHLNNRISSLCIPKGYTVRLHDLGNFHGDALVIKGPKQYEDLKRQPRGTKPLNWGDRITSIRVTRERGRIVAK